MSSIQIDERPTGRRISRALTSPVMEAERLRKLSAQNKQADSTQASSNKKKMKYSIIYNLIPYGIIPALGFAMYVTGGQVLQVAVLIVGYVTVAICLFLVTSLLYAWWGAKNMETLQFDIQKVVYCYLANVGAEFVSCLVYWLLPSSLEIPGIGLDPVDLVTFTTIVLLAFCMFVNNGGLDAVFSDEALYYVLLSLVLRYTSTITFYSLIPTTLTALLTHNGVLLGLTMMLWKHHHPNTPLAQLLRYPLGSDGTPLVINPSPSYSAQSSSRNSIASTTSRSSARYSRSSWSTYTSRNSSVLGFDPHLAIQAHGILGDLMLDSNLPNGVVQKLDSVQQLLAPRVTRNIPVAQHLVRTSIQHDRTDHEMSLHSQSSGSSHGGSLKRNSFLSIPHHATRSSRFSTTTTASGMPVVEPTPHARKRALVRRGTLHSISSDEDSPRNSTTNLPPVMPQMPKKSGSISPLTRSYSSFERDLEGRLVTNDQVVGDDFDEKVDAEMFRGRPKAYTLPPGILRKQVNWDICQEEEGSDSSDHRASVSSNGSDVEPRRLSSICPPDLSTISEAKEVEPNDNATSSRGVEDYDDDNVSTPVTKEKKDSTSLDRINDFRSGRQYSIYNKYTNPDLDYDLKEYKTMAPAMLQEVLVWDFSIDQLEKNSSGLILSRMAYCLFHEAGLTEIFQIPEKQFINYFRALEINYGCGVYHNSTHAADVLHATAYLLTEPIPEFDHAFQDDDTFRVRKTKTTGNMFSAFSMLELFACYMAAVMHDFDHPGRTNAFLVATRDPLAVLYNDRSVLENHHAAASWEMLTCESHYNFIDNLDAAEYKRLRFLIIEAILATDLKMHFDILDEFKTKINPDEGGGINWNTPEDRLMVLKMVIKMADINGPAKSWKLHQFWTERITEEFFRQGEEENRLGLPKTVFLERNNPEQLPKVQLSFIQNLVSPLFQVCAEAGLIPGQLSGDIDVRDVAESKADKSDAEFSDSDIESDLDDAEAMKGKKFASVILTNLEENYAKWQAQLPPENPTETLNPPVITTEEEGESEDTDKD